MPIGRGIVQFAVLCLLLGPGMVTPPVRAACDDRLVGAAGDEHLWVVADGPLRGLELKHHAVEMGGPFIRGQISLAEHPLALAAWKDRVWLTFPLRTGGTGGRPQREVFTVQIRHDRALGIYTIEPPDRLRMTASLPGEGKLIGMVGTADGPLALLVPLEWSTTGVRADGDAQGPTDLAGPRLLQLRNEAWVDVALPEDLRAASPAEWRLAAGGEGRRRIAILQARTRAADLCRVFVRGAEGTWTQRELALDLRTVVGTTTVGAAMALITRQRDTDRLAVSLLRPDRQLPIAELDCPNSAWTLLGLRDGLHLISEDGAGGLTHRRLDPLTGAIGVATTMTEPPATGRLWYVSLLLGATLIALLLVFIIRPASRIQVALPSGTHVLPAASRLTGLLMDLFPGGVLAVLILGCRPLDLVQMPLVATAPEQTLPYLLMIGVTFVHTTLTELLSHRSLGKALMGARVVGIDGRPPGPGRVVVRNLLKLLTFLIPPLVVIAVMNPSLQGLGDVAARTVVVGDEADAAQETGKDR